MMLTAKQVAQELFDQQVALAEELTDQGVLDKALLVETGEHPEGRKRGGLVRVHSKGDLRVYFCEGGQCWFAYDEVDHG